MMLLNYIQIRWINSYATLVVTWSMAWNRSRIKTFPTNTTNPSLSGHVTTVVIICSLTPVSFRLVSFKLYFLVLLFLLAWAVTGWDCRIECFVAHWVFCGQVMCIRTHKHTQTFRHSMDIKGVRSDALSHRPFFSFCLVIFIKKCLERKILKSSFKNFSFQSHDTCFIRSFLCAWYCS